MALERAATEAAGKASGLLFDMVERSSAVSPTNGDS
jgi:hypothetical protein